MNKKTPKATRTIASRDHILEWIHREIDKFDDAAGTRLSTMSIVSNWGPDDANWVWTGHFKTGKGAAKPQALLVVRGVIKRAQVRYLLDEGVLPPT